MSADTTKTGKKHVRIATLIFLMPILIIGTIGFISDRGMSLWPQYRLALALFSYTMIFSFLFLWFLGFWIFYLFALVCHMLFGSPILKQTWINAMVKSLRVLPYASAIGICLFFLHYVFSIGGWPYDFIYGIVGTVIGAWCPITIFHGWFKLHKVATAENPET